MSRPPEDLQTFIGSLRAAGELVEIDAPVSADLEVAEIHRRVIAAGGPALLFNNVRGAGFPLVTNLFGTQRRVELAFGTRPEELVARIAQLPEKLMPPTPGKLWQERDLFWSLAKIGLKRRRGGLVTQNQRDPDELDHLPALKTWQRDGGPFVTLPLVYTEHPDGKGHNLGMYRAQLFGDGAVGVHMQIGKGGGFHLAAAEAQNRPFPVNLHVGGPPALILSAIAPLPENVPELLLTSLMLGKRLPLAHNPAGPLPVVAQAEFCIVGEIAPGARRPEGPFGDHYGYYSETHDYPFMQCKALLHRDNAIFPGTVVGKPRQEDFFIGDYLQELLRPLLPVAMPGVIDLWSYGETGYHSLTAAIVRERYKREALVSAFRILGEGQLSLTKFLLLTDKDVDLRDFRRVLPHVLERCDFRTDLFIFGNLSMDSLDYAGPRINEGSKGVLLGVGDPIRTLPSEFSGAPAKPNKRVEVYCPGCLVVETDGYADAPDAPAKIAADPAFEGWPLIVLCDDAAQAARSSMNFLWTTFTRFDPASDVHAKETRVVSNHVLYEPPVVIDARKKPSYPEELFCDGATSELVDLRWKEYFPTTSVEMGDSARAHLD